MNTPALSLVSALLIGIGATFVSDILAMLITRALKIAPSNICFIGRWVRYMMEGKFAHASIESAPRKSGECAAGWITHYLVGVIFALILVAVTGGNWLQHPTLIPALLFGVISMAAPFLIMQPSFGTGIAASKAPNPAKARIRTVVNHTAFGVGLYLAGWLVSRVM